MKYKIVPYIQQESKDIERISKYAYNVIKTIYFIKNYFKFIIVNFVSFVYMLLYTNSNWV